VSDSADCMPPSADFVAQFVSHIFPNDTEIIVRLCYLNNAIGYPVGYSHPKSVIELLGGGISPQVEQDITAGYILLSAYYFFLDSFIDKQDSSPVHHSYLTHLITGSHYFFVKSTRSLPIDQGEVAALLMASVSDNSRAMRQEQTLHDTPLAHMPLVERESIIGRSNPLILLYQLCCLVSRTTVDVNVRDLLDELILSIQAADDLGDWRPDYERKQWSPFLRRTFQQQQRVLSVSEIEDLLYVRNGYEDEMLTLIRRFHGLARDLLRLPYPAHGLARIANSKADKLQAGLIRWIYEKLLLFEAKDGVALVDLRDCLTDFRPTADKSGSTLRKDS